MSPSSPRQDGSEFAPNALGQKDAINPHAFDAQKTLKYGKSQPAERCQPKGARCFPTGKSQPAERCQPKGARCFPTGDNVLGMEKVRAFAPTFTPEFVKRSPAPMVLAAGKKAYDALKGVLVDFCQPAERCQPKGARCFPTGKSQPAERCQPKGARCFPTGDNVLGMEKVRAFAPTFTPEFVKRSPAPMVLAAGKKAYDALKGVLVDFCNAFRRASTSSRTPGAKAIEFPPFSFPPGLPMTPGDAEGFDLYAALQIA